MENQHSQFGRQSHVIRLGSVWEPPAAGQTAWGRRFGRPSGIGREDHVVLVIERPAVASLILNGTPLSGLAVGLSRWTCDITALLEERNDLRLTPSAPQGMHSDERIGSPGRVSLPARYGVVSLEILTPPPGDRYDGA